MGAASRYWTLVKIDARGNRKVEEIAAAKAFFDEVFPDSTAQSEVPDDRIQHLLLQWVRDGSAVGAGLADSPRGKPITTRQNPPFLAERCLLCFISWQIEQVCLHLEARFSTFNRFTCRELLSLVLDDDGKLQSPSYQSFTRAILQSFDPKQGSLTTWTMRKVKQHPELSAFLLERGVYLVSDWAILNDTRPKQLERIFREIYQLTPFEIERARRLLECYHAVYRAERLQQRRGRNKSQCPPPTTRQLQQIALRCQPQTSSERLSAKSLGPETVMAQLQWMASLLRQYRISVRGGAMPTESLDAADPEHGSLANRIPSPDNSNALEDEQNEFLRFYRQQFLACLDLAVAQVTDSWVGKLQRKDAEKAKKFLMALSLFHCQGKSMTEIARSVRLQAQFQVTRLLRLKEFRADVRHSLAVMLRDRILAIAKAYTDMETLQTLDKKIEEPLNEQINQAIADAQAEGRNSKNRPATNLFAQRLCRHLDTRRN